MRGGSERSAEGVSAGAGVSSSGAELGAASERVAAGVAEAVGVSARDAPHSAQKRASSGYSERQRGQVLIVFSLKSYR